MIATLLMMCMAKEGVPLFSALWLHMLAPEERGRDAVFPRFPLSCRRCSPCRSLPQAPPARPKQAAQSARSCASTSSTSTPTSSSRGRAAAAAAAARQVQRACVRAAACWVRGRLPRRSCQLVRCLTPCPLLRLCFFGHGSACPPVSSKLVPPCWRLSSWRQPTRPPACPLARLQSHHPGRYTSRGG